MNDAARKQLHHDHGVLPPIDAAQVLNAPCRVVEPMPARPHYMLAFVLSTMATRTWMARIMVAHWMHRYPRLVVSDWDDSDAHTVGMRWGIALTWRGIAPIMCLADALCGRFDWVLFTDDDTMVDVDSVSTLLATTLAGSRPEWPFFYSFAPQPWPVRKDWKPSMHGCPGNVTRKGKHTFALWDAAITRRPCSGPPVPFTSPKRNMGGGCPGKC